MEAVGLGMVWREGEGCTRPSHFYPHRWRSGQSLQPPAGSAGSVSWVTWGSLKKEAGSGRLVLLGHSEREGPNALRTIGQTGLATSFARPGAK